MSATPRVECFVMRPVIYESNVYTSSQFFGLVRDLTANGWQVGLQCDEDTRPPHKGNSPDKYSVIVKHDGWHVRGAPKNQRRGNTPWQALSAAVWEIVIPAEREELSACTCPVLRGAQVIGVLCPVHGLKNSGT